MYNVNRNINDLFYRYKMPKIITKVEGNGNGIKTVIVNLPEVSTALYRNGSYVVKYFGNELGTQTIIDEKGPKYIINGSHDSNKLQDILDGFIKKFVLCSSCENPETVLTVKKKTGIVTSKCKACGHTDSLDPRHKITNYIIKNPPKIDESKTTTGNDTTKKGDNDDMNDDGQNEANSQDDDDDVWDDDDMDSIDNLNEDGANEGMVTSLAAEKTSSNKKEALKQVAAANGRAVLSNTALEEKSVKGIQSALVNMDIDKSAGAAGGSNRTKQGGAAQQKNLPVIEKTHSERIGEFYTLVTELFQGGEINTKVQLILQTAERLALNPGWVKVLIEICLSDPESIIEDIKKYRTAFVLITRKKGDEAEQRKTQKYFIAGIELTVQKFEKSLLPRVCMIMNQLYESDIVEEESILEWHSIGPAKSYKKDPQMQSLVQSMMDKCNPLVEWLKNAEEDDSDDSDNENPQKKDEPIKEIFVAQPVQKSNGRRIEHHSDEEVCIEDI